MLQASGRRASSPREGTETNAGKPLTVILEMLQSVETLTLPGQRYNIIKIVGLLEKEILRCAPDAADSKLKAITVLLPRLRSEAERRCPDAQAFAENASLLIDAIGEA